MYKDYILLVPWVVFIYKFHCICTVNSVTTEFLITVVLPTNRMPHRSQVAQLKTKEAYAPTGEYLANAIPSRSV